eukprot:PhM_4_TR16079/c5_g1_i1/m.94316
MDPYPVNLPTLPQLLEAFSEVEEMRALDLHHWCHQIPISQELKSWFTVVMGPLRLEWNVLPMGWKWVCFLAQAITSYAVAGRAAFEWSALKPLIQIGDVTFAVPMLDTALPFLATQEGALQDREHKGVHSQHPKSCQMCCKQRSPASAQKELANFVD